MLTTRGLGEIKEGLKVILNKYNAGNIKILEIYCDPECNKEKLNISFSNVTFESRAEEEHIPAIEQVYRIIKN